MFLSCLFYSQCDLWLVKKAEKVEYSTKKTKLKPKLLDARLPIVTWALHYVAHNYQGEFLRPHILKTIIICQLMKICLERENLNRWEKLRYQSHEQVKNLCEIIFISQNSRHLSEAISLKIMIVK